MTETRARRLTPVVTAAPARSGLRGLFAVFGVAGAVVAAGLVVWLGTAPGDEPGPVAFPDDAALTAESDNEEAGSAEAVDEPIPLPLVTYELFLARDPFEPVVPEPLPDPTAPVDPTDPSAPTDPSTPTDPSDPTTPTDPSDPNSNTNANGPCTGMTEVVCDGRVLSVVEVFEENGEPVAVIQVDTMRYEVGVGDIFADSFQVVSITPDEVRVLFGDRVVRLQVGDNALK